MIKNTEESNNVIISPFSETRHAISRIPRRKITPTWDYNPKMITTGTRKKQAEDEEKWKGKY